VQLDLLNVYNKGSITDYVTDEDEINIKIGVGDQFVYSMSSDFYRNQVWSFNNAVSFPCFSDDAFFIQMTEVDQEVDDYAQVQIDCKSI
jgi:hypothetical protein